MPVPIAVRICAVALVTAGLACAEPTEHRSDSVPIATITAPSAHATFRAGDTIAYAGAGQDAEDGALPGTALTWWADLHHDTHTHPLLLPTTGSGGSVVIPTSGETSDNIWYRFYLRAEDSDGRVDTALVEIFPRKAMVTIVSEPAGRTITLDGQPHVAPYAVLGVVGLTREIGTTSPQVAADSTYAFATWSDGGAQTHTIVTPETDTTFVVSFTATGPGNVPPTVALTAPTAGTSLPVNLPVALTATATDGDGTVVAVRFRDGTTVIAIDSTTPYGVSWTPTVAGSHTLTAVAVDDDDSTTTSAAVPVTVTAGGGGDTEAPAAVLTSPTDGTLDLTGALVFTATASDNVGVVGVEFQVDGVLLGEDLTAPYSDTLPATTPYTTGVHVVRVRARDAAGNHSPWASARVTFGGNVDLPSGFSRTVYAQGMNTTGTGMAFAPDGRLFVAEQGGALRVIKPGGALNATPFTTVATTANGERGLLGVAFHPNFATNHYLYVYYTSAAGGAHNRISRLTADPANLDVMLAASESVLVELPNLSGATNHNGGAMHFGADGKLYVAVGENANGSLAQSMTSVFGKILRLNDDGSIPADNPFYGAATGLNRAIWALGLRNPFTFAIQPGTGTIFINDVGQNSWEEINHGMPGANYGWPGSEGNQNVGSFTGPIFTYGHSANPSLMTGSAIVGAAFYNPATMLFPAEYQGHFFFGDLVTHFINRLDAANGNAAYAFARLPEQLTNLVVGPDGGLYAAASIPGNGFGVWRIGH